MDEAVSRHLGLDLGATNIKWALLERGTDAWRVLDRGQVPTLGSEGPAAVIGRLVELGRHARAEHADLAGIGLGVPGLFEAETGVTTFIPNIGAEWERLPVGGPISEAVGLPVTLINDARAFGLAELRLGAGRGCRTMVGMTIGSGVGGVVAVDGRLHFGHAGTAGEVGHQTLDPEGPMCTCGNRGCLEALACAAAIARACGTETAEQAVRAAHDGDRRAVDGLAAVGRWLGIGIANLVVVLTPDRVVVGGGVAAAGDLLLGPARAEVRQRVHVTDLQAVGIVPAELGTWAGAIGAGIHGAEAIA